MGPCPGLLLDVLAETGRVQSVCSPAILTEWEENAYKPSVMGYFKRRGVEVQDYIAVIRDVWRLSEVVQPAGEPPPCRDEKDRKYLHCAVEAQADFLVTTDKDLLVIGNIGGVAIVQPEECWGRLKPG